MSDANTSAPAETAPVRDFNPNDMQALADTLPDSALDFDDGDTEDTSDAPHEPAAPRAPRKPAEEPQEAEEGDEPDTEAEDDGTDADEAPEANGEEDGDEPEKPEPEKKDDPSSVFVEIDGHKVPIDEVRRGFMRQADYTRKTQALADETRQFQTVKQQTEAERGELSNILNIAVEVLRTRMPQPPDRSMIRDDPMGFMEQTHAYNDAVEEVNKLLSAQQNIGQRQTAEQRQAQEEAQRAVQAQTAEALQREAQLMAETMPELRTPEGQKAFFTDASKFGEHYGLTAEDIGGIQDHRALRVLKDAIAYRKLQAAKPAAMEKVKAAPPIRPAVRQAPGTRSGDQQKRAMDRLRREGSVEAAVATLDDSLFD